MNSNMVKTEKFGHLHLVYHFTVPLILFPKCNHLLIFISLKWINGHLKVDKNLSKQF